MSIPEFQSLVLNNAEGLTPFAVSLTRNYEAARDLCQETLCKAFVYRTHYQAGTNIKAWLYTIMRNIFINDYRREKRKKAALETVRYFEYSNGSYLPEPGRIKELHAAVYGLPLVYKNAFVLHVQGYKYEEIARALDEPLGTVKSRIHFARKILQKQIER
ncbi:RNA polymerase sigma factor [Paraflavisolibacter sp. H34]|uniref:RNA polymerase sigma factor n=1 Tax=Huijunlia imazamoxiresistens TaxID=3127457 RepID=UPI0030177A50